MWRLRRRGWTRRGRGIELIRAVPAREAARRTESRHGDGTSRTSRVPLRRHLRRLADRPVGPEDRPTQPRPQPAVDRHLTGVERSTWTASGARKSRASIWAMTAAAAAGSPAGGRPLRRKRAPIRTRIRSLCLHYCMDNLFLHGPPVRACGSLNTPPEQEVPEPTSQRYQRAGGSKGARRGAADPLVRAARGQRRAADLTDRVKRALLLYASQASFTSPTIMPSGRDQQGGGALAIVLLIVSFLVVSPLKADGKGIES